MVAMNLIDLTFDDLVSFILLCLDNHKFLFMLVSRKMRFCLCHVHLHDNWMPDSDSASELLLMIEVISSLSQLRRMVL